MTHDGYRPFHRYFEGIRLFLRWAELTKKDNDPDIRCVVPISVSIDTGGKKEWEDE